MIIMEGTSLLPFLWAIITGLLAIICYFVKCTFDKVTIMSGDVSDMKPKVDVLWKDKFAPATSPRQLNTLGTNILETSGVKQIVDEYEERLLSIVKTKNSSNPYDAEQFILRLMMQLSSHHPELIPKLKEGAFKAGVDIGSILLVGGIYLRNKLFPKLGFKLEELDKKSEVRSTL